jgi:hypothetical protein
MQLGRDTITYYVGLCSLPKSADGNNAWVFVTSRLNDLDLVPSSHKTAEQLANIPKITTGRLSSVHRMVYFYSQRRATYSVIFSKFASDWHPIALRSQTLQSRRHVIRSSHLGIAARTLGY